MSEGISITPEYPDLQFRTQDNIRICEYDGDLISDDYIEIIMDDVDIFICTGMMHAKTVIACQPSLIAQRGIRAGAYIRTAGNLHCCSGGAKSGEYIEARARIDVRGNLEAGNYISCEGIGCADGDIIAGGCITTETSIKTTGDIDCSKRIFAGVSLACTHDTCDDLIICRLLENGEVCAGQLIEGGGWMPEEGWC